MSSYYSQDPLDFPKSKLSSDGYLRCNVHDKDYNPKWHEDKRVLDNRAMINVNPGLCWADACALDGVEDLSQRRMWNPCTRTLDIVGNVTQMLEYNVNGKEVTLPFNPTGRTGLIGRGMLGKYGPNHAVDALVTSTNENGDVEVFCIQRADTGEWALVGGMIDLHEKSEDACIREFMEEVFNKHKSTDAHESADAFLPVLMASRQLGVPYVGYVDDPRNTDNAWMETCVLHYHLNSTAKLMLKPTPDPSEVRKAEWHLADDAFCDKMYASHGEWVKSVRDSILCNTMDSNKTEDLVSRSVHVANLEEHITESQLKEHFAKFGVVSKVHYLDVSRCAFIDFETKSDAREAFLAGHATIKVRYNYAAHSNKADRRSDE